MWSRRTILCFAVLLSGALLLLGRQQNLLAKIHHEAADFSTLARPIQHFHLEIDDAKGALGVDRLVKAHVRQAHERQAKQKQEEARTVDEALRHYRHRYGREPPRNLAAWTRFALQVSSVSIDDYDQVEASMAPLRLYPADTLKGRIETYTARKQFNTGLLTIKDRAMYVTGIGPDYQMTRLMDVLAPFNLTNNLRDMAIPINWDDLPNSFGSPKWRAFDDLRVGNRGAQEGQSFALYTSDCPRLHVTSSYVSEDRPTIDLCKLKDDIQREDITKQHGLWQAGQNPVDSVFPLLSWTKLSTQTDVIVPQTCYAIDMYRAWLERDNTTFEDKHSSVFWRGSPTGFAAKENNWQFGHRQRFILLMHEMRKAINDWRSSGTPLEASRAAAMLAKDGRTSIAIIEAMGRLDADLFDSSFTSVSCADGSSACSTMKAAMPLAQHGPRTDAYGHKYLFDADGNSMSCRFYWLLESNSLVFKQTIWAEWHDERLIPWLHYVPVSFSLRELPLLLDYFENHADGRQLAAQIARESRMWADAALRKTDITVYYYRVLVGLDEVFDQLADE